MCIPLTDAPACDGKYVLVRASLNVPVKDGVVIDATRIIETLPTILHIRERGGRVILISHHSGSADASLAPIAEVLRASFPVVFIEDLFSQTGQKALAEMKDGDVVLAENIRRYPGEENADPAFAEQLAALADFYVNDDFTVSHRHHASITLLPKLLPSFIGLRFAKEFQELSKAFEPQQPALLILGGAKPETKLPLAKLFLSKMNTIVIGGISANTLFQTKGYEVGASLVATQSIPEARDLLVAPNVVVPIDVRVKTGEGRSIHVRDPQYVSPEDTIVDAGPETIAMLARLVASAKFILWNGPLGDYELGYTESTFALAQMLTESSAHTIIGGGDTVASIASMGLSDKFSFVSTAGGAMIDFLAQGTLPGIDALKD